MLHLIQLGQWDVSHVKIFERCFDQSPDVAFSQICFDKIVDLGQEPSSSFLDHQLEKDHHPSLIRDYLLASLSAEQTQAPDKKKLSNKTFSIFSAP